tara:strand:+ start:344 stop:1330 length:987 start_codon:yes stop_codon:yes gene_type:complete
MTKLQINRPKITVIVCTHNSEKLIEKCINSILSQTYKNFEILCVDGFSKDKTIQIIKKYSKTDKRVKLIISNKNFPEGRGSKKWEVCKKTNGKIIGFIDSDNELQDKNFFETLNNIFNDQKNLIGVLGATKHDFKDSSVVRYVSLFGTDSFFAYRSLDFLRNLVNPKKEKINDSIVEIFSMRLDNLLLTGGNCFFYLKKDLDKIGGYEQDVLSVRKIVKTGKNNLFVLRNITKHYAEENFFRLVWKKFSWAENFSYRKNSERFDYLPKTNTERKEFIKNLFFNILLFPNLIYSISIYIKSKDSVSFVMPFFAFANTFAYGLNFIKEKI